jgi:hypothetical protein
LARLIVAEGLSYALHVQLGHSRVLMMSLWVVTGAALAVAVVAWLTARRATKRLSQLSEMYWELKYQHGELRNAVLGNAAQRMPGADTPAANNPAAAPPARPPDGFVPLKSLRR